MNKLTITEAAKLAGISRQYLYKKYINDGIISIFKNGNKSYIDLSEFLRVFPNSSVDINSNDNSLHYLTAKDDITTSMIDSKSQIIKILEQQLLESKERETWLQNQISELMQQQNHLLENNSKNKRKKWLGIF